MAPPKKCAKGLFHINANIYRSNPKEEREDPRIPFQEKDSEPGDYVKVAFARKNSVVHHVGIIRAAKDEDEDYEINFLCKSSRYKMSYAFVEPIREVINSVAADSILGVLPKPVHQSTKRQQGIIKFGVNFEGFNME